MGTPRFASGNLLASQLAAIAAAISSLLLAALLWGASPARATTQAFGSTGAEQTFVVPSGVTALHVLLIGGYGGEGSIAGGAAAEVTADLTVTPGQTLYLEVGGIGEDATEGGAGGFNGGAAGGGTGAGGGGGASDLRLLPRAAGLSPDTRLVIAGGGGGGGGGGLEPGGVGGDAGSPGGIDASSSNEGGGAGTATAGGAGGIGCGGIGTSGQLGAGGAGSGGEGGTNGGGGGAGGFYGGGGGGGGCSFGGGGGGGGSSFVPSGGSLEVASASAAPEIQITYTPPPPPPADKTTDNPPSNPPPSPNTEIDTVIDSHPRKVMKTTKKRVRVKFAFHSPTAGASFECKLDKGAYVACSSPKRYRVKVGKHKLSVRAVKGGVADPTPASFNFKVVKKAS